MTAPSTHPSRPLQWLALGARWALGVLLAAWLLLLAVWAVLHWAIVPRIDDFRPALERQAERALGIPVRLASISARSDGIFPTLELHDVALLDEHGRQALRLPRVVAALSPRSLLRLGFEQLYIEQPELDLRRTPDGRLLIAGLPLRNQGDDDSPAADWLLSQPEVFIAGGQLRWTDEQRQAPPLQLNQVDVLLRNSARRHAIRLDATPEATWGQRFSLRGQFRQPLLSTHESHWQHWSGQLFADFSQIDISRLHQYIDWQDVQVAQGQGALRLWADVRRGQWQGAVMDLALEQLQASLSAQLPALQLHSITGRLSAKRLERDGFEIHAEQLGFETSDGLQWPAGNMLLRHYSSGPNGQEQGQFQADALDLAMLAQIASRLPLGKPALAALQTYTPQGLIEQLQGQWQGSLEQPKQYRLQGNIQNLALAAQAHQEQPPALGLSGAQVRFDLNQDGGQAQLNLNNGQLLLPGIFEDPHLPLQQLSTRLRWARQGADWQVHTEDLRFANADAAGQAKLSWHTGATDSPTGRLPGVLELSGQLQRADATRVHRYLPLSIPQDVRHYVREAIVAGQAPSVRFRVNGNLHDFPFAQANARGEFLITAQVSDVVYDYVPHSVRTPGERPWPRLEGLSGELIFDRASMRVRQAKTRLPTTLVSPPSINRTANAEKTLSGHHINAQIADLEHPTIEVQAQASGTLQHMLDWVRQSPVQQMTDGALDQAQTTGAGQLQLQLELPLAHLTQSKVRGNVTLAGNALHFVPEAPTLSAARGVVQFDEHGFQLLGIQGQALGGTVRLEGGMPTPASALEGDSPIRIQAQGSASAQGLADWATTQNLPALVTLAGQASGSSAYQLHLGVRRGLATIEVRSQLLGMALDAPAPLGKTAQTPLALHIARGLPPSTNTNPATQQDQWRVQLGDWARVIYVRDLHSQPPQVLRGNIAIGQQPASPPHLPVTGVTGQLHWGAVDIDQWQHWLQTLWPTPSDSSHFAANTHNPYLPNHWLVQAQSLTWQGRSLHDVNASLSQQGQAWSADINARQLQGQLRYQINPSGHDLLRARLQRLSVPQASGSPVDALLNKSTSTQLPALDIEVQALELQGRHLGRLEIQANNHGTPGQPDSTREWRLTRFNLSTPEAELNSSGSWALPPPQQQPRSLGAEQRQTALNFELNIHDSGALLARLGMDGVLRKGQGRLNGQVSWPGSPMAPDFRGMQGQLHLDMQEGQFLKADPGLAKLLSVLSLQALPRRLTLDFRDIFSQGFAFDFVRGDVNIRQGVAHTNNLQMKGVNAAVLMEGQANIAQETQNLHVVVVPEINAMTASLVATAINPVIGLGSFLAQVFLRGPLIAAATQEFRIDGTWTDPKVERLKTTTTNTTTPPQGDKP